MFRFLVMEDVLSTLGQLKVLFEEAFPGAVVHCAATVGAASEFVIAAAEAQRPYDVAVLDSRVPSRIGFVAEVDDVLCMAIRARLPSVLIIHITAYPNDEAVLAHLRDIDMGSPDSPKAALVSKLESDWAIQLLSTMKQYLFGRQIETQLDRLFRDGRSVSGRMDRGAERERIRSEGDVTHELATLSRDIAVHWGDLNARLQERIRRVFRVDTQCKPIKISLL